MTDPDDILDAKDLPLFQKHSDTSRQAAIDIIEALPSLRRQVYEYFNSQEDGATDDECQYALDMNPSTQRPRRVELLKAGLVEDSGDRRRTRTGRPATVWQVKAKGGLVRSVRTETSMSQLLLRGLD